jgi:hypothetical protein
VVVAKRLIFKLPAQDRVELANASAQHRYIYMNGKLEVCVRACGVFVWTAHAVLNFEEIVWFGLQHVPTGVFELFGSPLMSNILPSIWRDVFSSRGVGDAEKLDETVESFISRRFSPTIAANLIDPLISGIYAGDISKLSMEAVFPSLVRLERLYGSVLRGAIQDAFHKTKATGGAPLEHSQFVKSARTAASVSFRGGMSTFTDTLAHAVMVRGCPVFR